MFPWEKVFTVSKRGAWTIFVGITCEACWKQRFKGPTQLCWASTSGGNGPTCVRASLSGDDRSPRVVPYLLSLGLDSQVEDAPYHKPDEADMGIYLKLFTWDVG